MLTVLSVAYPFAPVGPDAVGGAEQVLSRLDAALERAGHRSVVVACTGSRVAGELVPVEVPGGEIDDRVRAETYARVRQAIARALPADVVHLHGIDFHDYLPPAGVPALVTLHLPPSWYPREALFPQRPGTWLHCVSASQHRACPPSPHLLAPIENGVRVEVGRHARRGFALCLGRICPEKGFHLALNAARRAEAPLLIGGAVFPYAAHERYFRDEIRPRLDRYRRFIGPVGGARKRRLLSAARCLLVPSLAPETSSLVAMEALACGTPVVAFPAGALADIVEHGRTGFLVSDAAEMAEAIATVGRINPEVCRETVRQRFSLERCVGQYLELYQRLAA